jgi:ATP-binding cassette subfamily C protein EexD
MFHPMLGWMGVIAALVLLLLAIINQRTTQPVAAELNKLTQDTMKDTLLNLRNAEVVAAMGMVDELKRRWRQQQDALVAMQVQFHGTSALFTAITKTVCRNRSGCLPCVGARDFAGDDYCGVYSDR